MDVVLILDFVDEIERMFSVPPIIHDSGVVIRGINHRVIYFIQVSRHLRGVPVGKRDAPVDETSTPLLFEISLRISQFTICTFLETVHLSYNFG